MKRVKATARWSPCAWCEEYTKLTMYMTCLDTGDKKEVDEWIKSKETHARETVKPTASHTICNACKIEQMKNIREFVEKEGK